MGTVAGLLWRPERAGGTGSEGVAYDGGLLVDMGSVTLRDGGWAPIAVVLGASPRTSESAPTSARRPLSRTRNGTPGWDRRWGRASWRSDQTTRPTRRGCSCGYPGHLSRGRGPDPPVRQVPAAGRGEVRRRDGSPVLPVRDHGPGVIEARTGDRAPPVSKAEPRRSVSSRATTLRRSRTIDSPTANR